LVIAYAAVILWLVTRGALKIKSMTDYAVGSVVFSPVAVGLSLAASMTSAATFVINPGFIANYGLSGLLAYGLFFPLASIGSLLILTKSFRKQGQQQKALTLAQWIGKRYKSKSYGLFMAFLSLLLVTFIVLIVVAITKVLAKAMQVEELYVLAGTIVFVFGYMMFGGANSLVYTNMIQASIMILVALVLLFSGFHFFSDGLDGFLLRLSEIDPMLVRATNPESLLFRDFFEIGFAQFIVGVAVVVQPHIITKSLLLKHESDVNRYLVVAGLVQALFFSVVVTGLFARLTFPDLTFEGKALTNDGIIPAYVVAVFSGGFVATLVGLVVVLGLLSAGLSTLEGLIQSVSSSITTDIVQALAGGRIEDKRLLVINKLAIAFLALVAFWISRDQLVHPKLSVGILAQNGVYAFFSSAFVPVLFGIYFKEPSWKVPFASSVAAFLIHFGIYYGLPFLHAHNALDLGFFTKFLEGEVRNPAIAASLAILGSTLLGLMLLLVERVRVKTSDTNIQNSSNGNI